MFTSVGYTKLSSSGNIARVRWVSSDGSRLYLELKNGQTFTVDGSELPPCAVGSVVIVRPEENKIEIAPDDLWPEESWVGIVRLHLPDITVVYTNGVWKIVASRSDIEYREGNTVEAKDSVGVIRVLSAEPLKQLDLPVIDDTVISKFKPQKGERHETFEDFGGLQEIVDRARQLIETRLKYKDALKKINARPIKGVLFTGPPGTGKTMLARIIANNSDSAFYEISGPEVFSKWYGQTEEILRALFSDASKNNKAIIFFDEIDSVAGQRSDESHEASRRVVAQLLALMDGFTSDDNVIVIAATNRPQDIDVALRRPGRFDWEINFPLPNLLDRELILKSSSRRLAIDGALPHHWVAEKTSSWSAADLSAIWSEAALLAASDDRAAITVEDYIGGFERVSAQRCRLKKLDTGGVVSS